jgi:hypothetical protein
MFDQLVRRLRRRGDVHAAVSVNSGRDGRVTAATSTSVDRDEAEQQNADVLPERRAMTVMQPPHIIGAPIFEEPTGPVPIDPVPPEEA